MMKVRNVPDDFTAPTLGEGGLRHDIFRRCGFKGRPGYTGLPDQAVTAVQAERRSRECIQDVDVRKLRKFHLKAERAKAVALPAVRFERSYGFVPVPGHFEKKLLALNFR